MRQTCQNGPRQSYRREYFSCPSPWRAEGENVHDLVWVIQLCKPNDERQRGQHGDGDLTGALRLHVLLDGTSISLNSSCIQFPGVKPAGARTHRMIEVGGQTLAFFVRIVTGGPRFDGGRPSVSRAEAADPGWTSWGGHDIPVYLTEFYTCPRLFRVGVLRGLRVCHWQWKYGYTFNKELVAEKKFYGGETEGDGGDKRWLN